MGCDIHLFCEKLVKNIRDKEFWWCCDDFTMNELYEVFEESPQYYHHSIYNDRDYELFGILAGVRDQSVRMIHPPKGLPDDVSDYVKSEADDFGIDGHTHSWLTAEELFKYDKKYPGTPLHYLVKCVKKKMKEVFNIWDFYSKEDKKRILNEHANGFRIVFWFDN